MPKSLRTAYFTMEIGLKASIPTFAGGLGVLAADLMRAAADVQLDATCVTMCWQFGYLRQQLRPDGTQEYGNVTWNPEEQLRLLPQRVTVSIEGRDVTVAARMLELTGQTGGIVPVLFLDTNLPENDPAAREITRQLYGGDGAMRIRQELVLGIGGVRMLRALGYAHVKNFHLNEGHCAFLTLELLRERGFSDADVRKSCAFTTHTPVKAGHDVFDYDLAWKVAGDTLPWHIKKLAGEDALSMTRLAMSLCRYTCGVSQVHGQVSRAMLGDPSVDAITNGVHHREWASPEMQELFDRCVPGWREDPSLLAAHCRDLPDDELWAAHASAKKRLFELVNADRAPDDRFDPDVLTIGSARRVVPYKRPELLYTNIDRLREVGNGRLQILHAGNAHPNDPFSQEVIRHMVERARALKGSVRIAYLPNYNPDLARLLVSGSDVWLNTPMRLHEASGTSGMKACLNGVLNLSTLDGWWIEGYARDPESGWRIGPLASSLDAEDTRKIDAEDLYTQLQYEVMPEYVYPGRVRWLRRMKRAIGLMGHFNAQRCIEEYMKKAWPEA